MREKQLFKILALSMLAAIGVMAVNAAAAQAKWELRSGEKSVSELKLLGSIDRGTLLVPGLLRVECAGGTASATLKGGGTTTLTSEGTVTFTGCGVLNNAGQLNTNCIVHSTGQANGTIIAKGSGTGSMEGAKYFSLLSSLQFAIFEVLGALCPLVEAEMEVNGSVFLTLDTAETDAALHQVLIDEDELLYLNSVEALLDDNKGTGSEGKDEPLSTTALQGSAKEASASTWSVRLTGL